MLDSLGIPEESELHYANSSSVEAVNRGIEYWIHEADKALRFELQAELIEGEYKVDTPKWEAKCYRKALELLNMDGVISGTIKTKLYREIEVKAMYAADGYQSAEEWFASAGSSDSQKSDYRFVATLAEWCDMYNVFGEETKNTLLGDDLDKFFMTPVNQNPASDGVQSRTSAIRAAVPTLRRLIDEDNSGYQPDLSDEERVTMVRNILAVAADGTITHAAKKKAYNVANTKVDLTIFKNGSGKWHLVGELDDHNLDTLKRAVQFAANVEHITTEEAIARGLIVDKNEHPY